MFCCFFFWTTTVVKTCQWKIIWWKVFNRIRKTAWVQTELKLCYEPLLLLCFYFTWVFPVSFWLSASSFWPMSQDFFFFFFLGVCTCLRRDNKTNTYSNLLRHTHSHTAECWQCVPSFSGESAVDGSSESIELNSANDVHSTWDAAAT